MNNREQTFEQFVDTFFGKLPVIVKNVSSALEPIANEWYNRESSLGAINIKETEKEYKLELVVPGFTKEDIKIEVEDNLLVISAKVEDSTTEEKWFRKEFAKKSFVRSFNVPEDALIEGITAKVENGVLFMNIPKTIPEKKTKKIVID